MEDLLTTSFPSVTVLYEVGGSLGVKKALVRHVNPSLFYISIQDKIPTPLVLGD